MQQERTTRKRRIRLEEQCGEERSCEPARCLSRAIVAPRKSPQTAPMLATNRLSGAIKNGPKFASYPTGSLIFRLQQPLNSAAAKNPFGLVQRGNLESTDELEWLAPA